jgi:hypothetical protein
VPEDGSLSIFRREHDRVPTYITIERVTGFALSHGGLLSRERRFTRGRRSVYARAPRGGGLPFELPTIALARRASCHHGMKGKPHAFQESATVGQVPQLARYMTTSSPFVLQVQTAQLQSTSSILPSHTPNALVGAQPPSELPTVLPLLTHEAMVLASESEPPSTNISAPPSAAPPSIVGPASATAGYPSLTRPPSAPPLLDETDGPLSWGPAEATTPPHAPVAAVSAIKHCGVSFAKRKKVFTAGTNPPPSERSSPHDSIYFQHVRYPRRSSRPRRSSSTGDDARGLQEALAHFHQNDLHGHPAGWDLARDICLVRLLFVREADAKSGPGPMPLPIPVQTRRRLGPSPGPSFRSRLR